MVRSGIVFNKEWSKGTYRGVGLIGLGQKVLLLCLILVQLTRAAPLNPGSEIDAAFSSMEKAIKFYSFNFDKVNLDSIFGVRVAQGSLQKAVNSQRSSKVPLQILSKIKKLSSTISEVADSGYRELKASKSSYVDKFEHLIDKKWFFLLPYQTADPILVKQREIVPKNENDGDLMEGPASDECMTSLIGSQEDGHQEECVISNKCWNVMMDRKASGYSLTHQALYVTLAERQGCKEKVVQRMGSNNEWKIHMRYLGSKIQLELSQKYSNGFTADRGKDLFLEQVIVCQMLGIIECFDLKYLVLLIKWQEVSGCWKEPFEDENDQESKRRKSVDQDIEGFQDEAKENETGNEMDEKETNGEEGFETRGISRRLHEEKILSDGCASHLTGVAIGLLGMYIYWFFNPHDADADADADVLLAEDSGLFPSIGDSAKMAQPHRSISIDARWVFAFVFVAFCLYFFRRWMRLRGRWLKRYLKFNQ